MSAAVEQSKQEKRYLRDPKVVFIRPLEDELYEVTDMEHKNPYQITREVFKREYVEI